MLSATLTTIGRAAIAQAIKANALYLAWGEGLPEWDNPETSPPSLLTATALVAEVGRRIPTTVAFVKPADDGNIIVPTTYSVAGNISEDRYRIAGSMTPHLYIKTQFNFEDAATATIREIGLFMGGSPKATVPPGQRYFLPSELADPGFLLAAQIIQPGAPRSAATRETIDFVMTL